jgi:hypothetical protein
VAVFNLGKTGVAWDAMRVKSSFVVSYRCAGNALCARHAACILMLRTEQSITGVGYARCVCVLQGNIVLLFSAQLGAHVHAPEQFGASDDAVSRQRHGLLFSVSVVEMVPYLTSLILAVLSSACCVAENASSL